MVMVKAVVRGRARARRLQLVSPHGELGHDLVGETERDSRLQTVRLQAQLTMATGSIACGCRLYYVR